MSRPNFPGHGYTPIEHGWTQERTFPGHSALLAPWIGEQTEWLAQQGRDFQIGVEWKAVWVVTIYVREPK